MHEVLYFQVKISDLSCYLVVVACLRFHNTMVLNSNTLPPFDCSQRLFFYFISSPFKEE